MYMLDDFNVNIVSKSSSFNILDSTNNNNDESCSIFNDSFMLNFGCALINVCSGRFNKKHKLTIPQQFW